MQCGSENVNEAKFCKSCGASLVEIESSSIPEPSVIRPEPLPNLKLADATPAVEQNTEVALSWSGWLLLFPVIAWVLYRLAVLAGGDIGLIFGLMAIPNVVAEALGGAAAIIGVPLIVTLIIYLVKKTQDAKYTNFVKHTLIGSIILLAFGIAANINTIRDEQKDAALQTIPEAEAPAAAAPAAEAPPVLSEVEQAEQDCNNGQASRCTNAGYMYDMGQGIQQDHFKAAGWYRKGCDGGDADGCYNLGLLYANGKSVEQDYFQSAIWFKKACTLGNAGACNNLGVQYINGQGVNKDDNEAVKLYKKACEGKDGWGCNNLGNYYYSGTSVERDYSKATKLYKKACKLGNQEGCKNVEQAKAAALESLEEAKTVALAAEKEEAYQKELNK